MLLQEIWEAILTHKISSDTNFFKSGGGSMDVVRLVEEIKHNTGVVLQNDDVYMNPTLEAFVTAAVVKSRSHGIVSFEFNHVSSH